MRRAAAALTVLALFQVARAQELALAGIAHVAFRVSDYLKARDFYTKLDFEQAFEFTDSGKPRVSYIKVNDHQFIELYEKSEDSQQLGLMHICFETDNIEALRAAYIKEGLDPSDIRKFRAGNLLFTMHDPEGQLIEYTKYLPGSLHSNDRGKHLGAHRVSELLLGSSTPAKDFAAQREYYIHKLSFAATHFGHDELDLPGNSRQRIALSRIGSSAHSSITFAVANTKDTAADLRSRSIAFKKESGRLVSTDPDGTLVIFDSRSGRGRATY